MSKVELTGYGTLSEPYDFFSQRFYEIWGDSPEVMGQAQEINDLINNYLYAFGVTHPFYLPREIQEVINEKARVTIQLGGDDD